MSVRKRVQRLIGRVCWRLIQLPGSVTLRITDRLALSRRVGREDAADLLDKDYQSKAWQLDPVSGHRWDVATWYRDINTKPGPGIDIKRPWEIARMQHLPALAFACTGVVSDRAENEARYRVFRNEVLDFIGHNPPRFGVHWQCAMEVGIRAVNWIVTRELFVKADVRLDAEFEKILSRSLYEHGRHIANNLETGTLPVFLANHYLADIVGLLFIAGTLPCSPEVDRWLAFGVQELIEAVHVQYGADGGNFEASTCYHALSSEMIIYGTALVLGLGAEKLTALKAYQGRPVRLGLIRTPLHVSPIQLSGSNERVLFPDWYSRRVAGMADFVAGIMKENGEIPQIGDNDSGRLLMMTPDAHGLDHRHVLASCSALFDRTEWPSAVEHFPADHAVTAMLARGRTLSSDREPDPRPSAFRAYRDFGLFVYHRKAAYIALRCGHNGQNGNGGHAHNDQLSFEFALGKQNIVVDPGTHVYTPDPDQRDRFRSTAMHNVMMPLGAEQNRWPSRVFGLFMLNDDAHARVLTATEDTFVGQHEGYGFVTTRSVKVADHALTVVDSGGSGERLIWFHLAPEVVPVIEGKGVDLSVNGHVLSHLEGEGTWSIQESQYSVGYGLVQETRCVCLKSTLSEIQWALRW